MTAWDVWARMADRSPKGTGWTMVARDVTTEQADAYTSTFLFQVHVEEARGGVRDARER